MWLKTLEKYRHKTNKQQNRKHTLHNATDDTAPLNVQGIQTDLSHREQEILEMTGVRAEGTPENRMNKKTSSSATRRTMKTKMKGL